MTSILGKAFQVGTQLLGASGKSSIDLSGVPKELRGLLQEQLKMNEEQQLVTRITNMMKSKHDSAMTILNNMK
ncbi:hypothetical protein ACLESD_49180 [Pyxidicoccus sp. 3LFB2]